MSTSVSQYYHSLESQIGYKVMLGGTRHFGYYKHGTHWPFPISAALRRMEAHLYQTLGLTGSETVLDAGTGNGDVAVYMAQQGLKVKAIDLLDLHVGFARRNIKRKHVEERVTVSQGNYEKLEFDNESFDGAYTMETLVHASDPEQAMREFYRVLKPGGIVVHVEYEHDLNEEKLDGLRAMSKINEYAHMPGFQQFPLGAVRKTLEKVGFHEVEVQDLSQNVAPLMHLFFLIAYVPYLIIVCLGLQKHFANAMAAVELWRYRNDIRYVMVKATKPSRESGESHFAERR